ncbi:MAG: glycosyltransferase [Lachnospiraceae bacterium]|jgi:glycosyltransferase involved in cell wall biosynthesis|nr:glycosyltransferase [Lachnospiraceae bacterium]
MISIIVPIYNVEKYLPQCIESICDQTYRDLEIILVNDGSTDGCRSICEHYRKKDSRIVVIHKENEGLVNARKTGVSAASGEYIAYVDGDDWIEPSMYERMYRAITEQNVDVVMCGRYEDTGNVHKAVFQGIPEGKFDKQALIEQVYTKMIVNDLFFEWGIFPSVWDKLFRRGCIERFQMEVDERIVMGEDAACVYPCLLNANSIYIMSECLYHYRQTTSSMVKRAQDYAKEREQFRILYRSVNEQFEKYASIYDLRQQWKKYVLFLMIPRADGLYAGYEELAYLFPFSKVKRGKNVVIYGAGTYGQRLFTVLKKSGFCHIAAWVDRNYQEFQKMGLPVEDPGVIANKSYDAIIAAVTYARSRQALFENLVKSYPEEKIHLIDEDLIFAEETMMALGL